ncbi:MAG: glycerol-3-phosphate acyltransferase [Candidatus Promineifilaceae bacterium]|nr:glycerol-3-phosphate acyltransferase [Candidatus Promineifilaceae bacterium]
MHPFLWFLLAFFAGSLPFSAWITRLFLGRNIRNVGDGNPGATNVFHAGGVAWGILALLLDFLKGALPVGAAAYGAEIAGWPLALIALAPALGHAFSPFLRGRGGKAIAATVGLWTGLTFGPSGVMLGIFLTLGELLLNGDAWAVLFGMGGLGAHLLLNHPGEEAAFLLSVWTGNTLLLIYTHRTEYMQPPRLRRWLERLVGADRAGGAGGNE